MNKRTISTISTCVLAMILVVMIVSFAGATSELTQHRGDIFFTIAYFLIGFVIGYKTGKNKEV
jgi:cytochrome c biogenesis protein CcdA